MDIKKETHFSNRSAILFVFFIALFLSIDTCAFAQGDLLIFPKRIVFEGRNRVEKITLSNTGQDAATYNISFIEYKMTESGDFEKITEADLEQRIATPFLRVFPRRVDLAPGESQTVKVQLINTDKLEEGEYRSHLYFRAERNNTPLGEDKVEENSETVTVMLEAVFGISIATIIRKGEYNTVTTISALEYTKDKDSNHFLIFNINRTGNMSTYGDVTVNYISDKNKMYEVGKVNGLAVYTPGNFRKIKMQLQKLNGIDFSNGKFEVVYTENEKKKIIAKAELKL